MTTSKNNTFEITLGIIAGLLWGSVASAISFVSLSLIELGGESGIPLTVLSIGLAYSTITAVIMYLATYAQTKKHVAFSYCFSIIATIILISTCYLVLS